MSSLDPTALIWMTDPLERDLVRLLLRQSGFVAATVEDPSQLLDRIHEQKPVLLFMDVMLPGSNGLVLVQQIKRELRERAPITALVSALTFPEVVSRAREAGADEFFGKPLDSSLLRERIQKMVNKALSAGVKKPE